LQLPETAKVLRRGLRTQTCPLGFSSVGDAVRRYKVGVTEDPWARIDRKKIQNAATRLSIKLKGSF
jgi:hypothetical protein